MFVGNLGFVFTVVWINLKFSFWGFVINRVFVLRTSMY
nr:MAG TPA: hypothetical protein [Caudoviricetes sp.]